MDLFQKNWVILTYIHKKLTLIFFSFRQNDLNSWFTSLCICRILFETWKIFPLCIVPSSSSNSFQLSYSVKSNEKGFFAQIRRELFKGKISIIYSPDPTTNSETMNHEFSRINHIVSIFFLSKFVWRFRFLFLKLVIGYSEQDFELIHVALPMDHP